MTLARRCTRRDASCCTATTDKELTVNDLEHESPSGRELGRLTEAAIGVLEGADDGDPELADVQSMPQSVLQEQISTAAESLGFSTQRAVELADIASRGDLAPDVARTVLAELSRDATLGAEIAESNRRRGDLMAIDPLTISAAALLLLALRVRRVRVSKDGVDVNLAPLKVDIVEAVLGFIGRLS
jgi:hypothetical protein